MYSMRFCARVYSWFYSTGNMYRRLLLYTHVVCLVPRWDVLPPRLDESYTM